MPESAQYDERYLAGILYFNACEFFEAHEVWEELWVDTEGAARPFFQGLIQVAVCLHHFGNGNTRGARKLYHGSRGYLDNFQPRFAGLDVTAFLQQFQVCCAEIVASSDEFPRIEIDPELIPEIHLDPLPPAWPTVNMPDYGDPSDGEGDTDDDADTARENP